MIPSKTVSLGKSLVNGNRLSQKVNLKADCLSADSVYSVFGSMAASNSWESGPLLQLLQPYFGWSGRISDRFTTHPLKSEMWGLSSPLWYGWVKSLPHNCDCQPWLWIHPHVFAMFESPGGIPWNCPATWRVCHHQKSSAMDAWRAERHAHPGCRWPGACSPENPWGICEATPSCAGLGSNNVKRCNKHSV